ncbi:MAG: type IV pilus assembly protein PilM [Candidatus Levybacteria bacterium]|nr:type IV pilus assembly protein PilM [Candidatus Levybacteria bacterium]
MSNSSFGLDIGVTNTRAVWLDYAKEGFLLKASAIAPTPPKSVLSESPLDQEEMAQAIRNVVDKAKITVRNVNIAFPENQVYTKVIDMPVLSDKELAFGIYWEAEQYIPVPLSTITLVWSVLKKPQKIEVGSTEKMQVLMVGAPTALINKYQKILSMAGLNIVSIETEILSAIRALVPFKANVNIVPPTTVIISIGAVSTSLAIIKEGILVFTYSIPIGGIAINRAIESDFGLTLPQAEEYKKTYGFSKEGVGGKIGKSIEPILTSIAAEVKKSLAFYAQKYNNQSPIQQILLSGGTAKLPGIDLFFAQDTGIETAIGNPWKVLTSQEVPKDIIDQASDYSVAVGLAMKGYD